MKRKWKNLGISSIPKKSKKADMRNWSGVFFTFALAALVWGSVELLNLTKYDIIYSNSSSGTSTTVVQPTEGNESGDDKINILSLEVEQIEALANTIAGQNAIWPGYKGDPTDHRAVQRHFAENYAKYINSGIIQVEEDWAGQSIAFAYAVTADGVVTFVGAIPGGSIKVTDRPDIYQKVSVGISGKVLVTPAQDESGENIIMLYYIKVRFSLV